MQAETITLAPADIKAITRMLRDEHGHYANLLDACDLDDAKVKILDGHDNRILGQNIEDERLKSELGIALKGKADFCNQLLAYINTPGFVKNPSLEQFLGFAKDLQIIGLNAEEAQDYQNNIIIRVGRLYENNSLLTRHPQTLEIAGIAA